MDILLYFGGPILIAFLIQILIGCRTQHKILRYIPIYCFVIAAVFAIIALTADSGFLIGGNVIASFVLPERGWHRHTELCRRTILCSDAGLMTNSHSPSYNKALPFILTA